MSIYTDTLTASTLVHGAVSITTETHKLGDNDGYVTKVTVNGKSGNDFELTIFHDEKGATSSDFMRIL